MKEKIINKLIQFERWIEKDREGLDIFEKIIFTIVFLLLVLML